MYKCELCGAYLDAGEKCDCEEEEVAIKANEVIVEKRLIYEKCNIMY